MIQKIKITIIVPIYKVEKYIDDCIQSIIAQTYTGDMECMLVDDCSPDKSVSRAEELLKSYSGPIHFQIIHHERNKGLSSARNTGLEHASGDYIYFLDSDDVITPDCMANLAGLVLKYPEVDFVQGCTADLKTRTNLTYSMDLPEYVEGLNAGRLALRADIFACNKLTRTDFIKKHQLSFNPGLIHEDVLWLYYMSKCLTTFATSKEVTYLYRTNNSGSIMNSSDLTKRAFCTIKIYETISLSLDADKWRDECRFLDNYCKFTMFVSAKHSTIDTNAVFRTALKSWFKVIRQGKYMWPKLYGFTYLPFRWLYCTSFGYRLYCKMNYTILCFLRIGEYQK